MRSLWVFDLDGTLVDSAFVVAAILNEKRAESGKVALPVSEFIPWISLGGEQLVGNALGIGVDTDSVAEHLVDFRRRYLARPTPLHSVFPGARELLEDLARYDRRIAICTNKPRALAEKVLGETGLDVRVDFLCAGDDLLVRKPDAETLKVCLRRFSASPDQALLVGDSTVDHETAVAAGVPFVFFAAGYDDGVSLRPGDLSARSHFDLRLMFLEGLIP